MPIYTDLADELYGPERGRVPEGVRVSRRRVGGTAFTRVLIRREGLARPQGRYVTAEVDLTDPAARPGAALQGALAGEIRALLPAEGLILVVGVGNRRVTADALGPRAAGQVLVTRGLAPEGERWLRQVASIAPGVAGRTGVPLEQLVQSLIARLRPAAVLCIDSLAAADPARLGRTVQLSDAGLWAGRPSGGRGLTPQALGVPVLALGIPTMMDAAALAGTPGLVLTPRDLDGVIRRGAALLAAAVNQALQPRLTLDELDYLVS